jgi:hypothetical protein
MQIQHLSDTDRKGWSHRLKQAMEMDENHYKIAMVCYGDGWSISREWPELTVIIVGVAALHGQKAPFEMAGGLSDPCTALRRNERRSVSTLHEGSCRSFAVYLPYRGKGLEP